MRSLRESPVSVTFSLQSRIKSLIPETLYFHLCFAQQKKNTSTWRHNQSRMFEKRFSARCNVAAISINFWLCPQSAIPGLATRYGKGAVHITRLACHLHWIFGLGTVKSHGNNISVLQGEGDVIMCQWTHNREFIKIYLRRGVREKGVRKHSFYFRHKAKDQRLSWGMCIFLDRTKHGRWRVSGIASSATAPREKGQEYSECLADISNYSIMISGPEGKIQK